jgi:hypothetical protein
VQPDPYFFGLQEQDHENGPADLDPKEIFTDPQRYFLCALDGKPLVAFRQNNAACKSAARFIDTFPFGC